MFIRNEVLFKWALYAAAAILVLAVQEALLQRVHIWGVIPFVYPLLAVIPATFEAPAPGVSFALAVGVVCDLLLPGSFPCFYTLLFPPAALCAAVLSQRLPAGLLCSLLSGVVAYTLTGFFHCFLLWSGGKSAWGPGLYTALREFVVSVPLILPLTPFFRAVAEKTALEE